LIQALVILVDEIGNGNGAAASRSVTLAEDVQKFETNLICNALRQTRGNQKQVSSLLGIKQSTLNEKIKRYGIDPKLFMLAGIHLQDQAASE
jgi:DNA-binding NtrC family response regulator